MVKMVRCVHRVHVRDGTAPCLAGAPLPTVLALAEEEKSDLNVNELPAQFCFPADNFSLVTENKTLRSELVTSISSANDALRIQAAGCSLQCFSP